jgi:hypothetical protein
MALQSGFSACKPCRKGTHNPNPAKHEKCACLLGHEPVSGETCEPCAIGHYNAAPHAACTKCPDVKRNHTKHLGSSKYDCARAGCVVRGGSASSFLSYFFFFFILFVFFLFF